ncbi:MAG: ABC transporter substrate-binding protein [Elusimicrobiota bacterium]
MKIWILNDYNYNKYSFFFEMAKSFYKERGIPIEIEIKSRENIWKSLFCFFEKPDLKLADIIEIPHQWTSLAAKLGLSLPVEVIAMDFDCNKIFEFLKKTMTYENTSNFFSLPVYFEIMALFYKKDMLLRVAKPSEMENLKWTDLPVICEKLKKKYRGKNYYPFDNTNPCGYITSDDSLVAVMNRSEGYFSDDGTTVNTHKDEVVISLSEFLDLAVKGYFPLFEESFFDMGFLKRNLSSLAFSFRRDLMEIKNIEVCRFPDIMRKNELVRSYNFIFFSGTSLIEELRQFISWFYEPQKIIPLIKSIGVFSPFKSDPEKYITKKELNFYLKLIENASPIPNRTVYPSFENALNEVLKNNCVKILSGDYDYLRFKEELIEVKGFTEYLITSY